MAEAEEINLSEGVIVTGFKRVWSWAGTCSANTELQNLKDAIEKGEQAIEIAESASDFLSINPQTWHNLQQAREALGKVAEGLDKAENICKDIKAIKKIHGAIKILKDDSVIYDDPLKASEAFGELFSGFGILARHLPSPADSFAQVLERLGGIFGQVTRDLIPDFRTIYERHKKDIW